MMNPGDAPNATGKDEKQRSKTSQTVQTWERTCQVSTIVSWLEHSVSFA